MNLDRTLAFTIAILALAGCAPADAPDDGTATPPPPAFTAGQPADDLIREGETHLANLRQLTFGGENAEAYWSQDGTKLIFQSKRDGRECDQVYVLDLVENTTTMVSTGAPATRAAAARAGVSTPAMAISAPRRKVSPPKPRPTDSNSNDSTPAAAR